ncbi:LLM class flavin-dependent oxidoreductase [Gordonia sp. CPCC 205515]|uniref:LLM class flavin-dependent oxidoreductase n=1 Tax=Gordonia sp. CPCC 205515 TaxID=3140791 RepID=UPI003AF406F7
MWFGAHLPLIDPDITEPALLAGFVDAARSAGFRAISANDHVLFGRPWLDGLVALSSVVERSADLTLATTVALPVIRGPAVLAKTAAALDVVSGGRFVLGLGPGSSAADYAAVGIPFAQRWPRFDESVRVLRASLTDDREPGPRQFYDVPDLAPRPPRSVPIWIGSWGSAAGLRRVARHGDAWIASAYNTTPDRLAAGRRLLLDEVGAVERDVGDLPIVLATMWTYLTDSVAAQHERLDTLARMLKRDTVDLAQQVLIGSADSGVATLTRYADAGVDGVFIWPLADPIEQLHRFGTEVAPHLRGVTTSHRDTRES